MTALLCDLHAAITREADLPPVSVVGLNGIPIIGDPPTYFGHPVTTEGVREQLRLALGMGGVLTHGNRSKLSLEDLADLSLKHGHDWAFRAVTATLCFYRCPVFVEMSFGRDGRFHLSWVENRIRPEEPRIFTATGSLHAWKRYLAHRDDSDFLAVQREWLGKAADAVIPLLPEYLA